jgi:aspartyl-tRNA(Asn)/glutamyl-tRNA(Gln) amidotransferase subunit B
MGETLADANANGGTLRLAPAVLARLIGLVRDGVVSNPAAKRVFAVLAANGSGDPRAVAESLGLVQVADSGALGGWVDAVLSAQPGEVARYKAGESKLFPFFVGQVMKTSKGKADPTLVTALLKARLAG